MLEPDGPLRRIAKPRFAAKTAVAAVVGSLALGGVAAAATTGSLPDPLQSVAHVLGAPAGGDSVEGDAPDGLSTDSPGSTDTASPSTDPSTDPSADPSTDPSTEASSDSSAVATAGGKGPDALGPAAFGLCHAFGNKTWGNGAGSTASPNPAGRKPDNPSVAYRNLVAAAASKGLTVDAFCTVVLAGHGVPSVWPTPASSGPTSIAPATPLSLPTHGHGHGHHHAGGNGHGHTGSHGSGRG